MEVSLSQASKITGKSKNTLHKAIKEGVISATRRGVEPNSPFQIDVSELLRVFPAKSSAALKTSDTPLQPSERNLTSSLQEVSYSQTRDDTLELAVLRERAKHYEDRIQDLKDQLSEAKLSAEDYRQRFLEADTKLLGVLKTITPNTLDGSEEHERQLLNRTADPIEDENEQGLIDLNSSNKVNSKQRTHNPFILTDAHRVEPKPKKTFYQTRYQFRLDDFKLDKSVKDIDNK